MMRNTTIGTAFPAVFVATLVAAVNLQAADNEGPAGGEKSPQKTTATDGNSSANQQSRPATQPPVKVGLVTNDPGAFPGYNLMSPLNSTDTFLFDLEGRVVKKWQSDCSPALCPYLLDNGHLLRGGSIGIEAQVFGPGPGVGGRIQEFTWEGEVVWDFRFYNARQLPHHDLTPLPNGNVLLIVWDRKTADEALAAGRRPELTGDSHLLVDSLLEIKPTGRTSGEVVWEWHLWDHLVQDFDKSKPDYGNVAEHPELVNLNYGEDALAPAAADKDAANKLKSVGYIGAGGPPGRGRANPDWTHMNGVAFNPALDQVMVSVHNFSEMWIIDHSTTTAEAAGHSGGRSGKGGDLLYRWGNPRAYHAGKKEDQRLFAQHNAHWIAAGLAGEGHVLVFNNGGNRPDGSYSSVDEIVLPVDREGRYEHQPGKAYGPEQAVWSYTAPTKTDFYSFFISGAQRLPNGNTLICSGANGTVFEATPDKNVVWKYVNPLKGGLGSPGGFAVPPRPGQILSSTVRALLAISAEQAQQLDEAQQDADRRLADLLTAEQRQQFDEPQPPGQASEPPPPANPPAPAPGGFGPSFQAGRLLSAGDERRLKLSDEQKKEVAALQKDVDGRLDKILTKVQRKQTKGGFAFGGPPGPGGPGQGGPFGAPPRPGQLLPPFARQAVKLTDEQNAQLDTFQVQVDDKLGQVLSDEQGKQLKEAQGPASMAPPGQPGQLMSITMQVRLKLNAEQKKQLQALQKETDAKMSELLTDDQKQQLKQIQANPPRPGSFVGAPGGGPGGPGGPGGLGGPPGSPSPFAPGSVMPVFRVYRYPASHPGLAGKKLVPGKSIEEIGKASGVKTAQVQRTTSDDAAD